MSFSKTLLYLLSTGSTQEDPSRHNCKIVDLDVKNQIKETNENLRLLVLVQEKIFKGFLKCMFLPYTGSQKDNTVKPVLSGHSKRIPKLVFNTQNRLMQVKSIAESVILYEILGSYLFLQIWENILLKLGK